MGGPVAASWIVPLDGGSAGGRAQADLLREQMLKRIELTSGADAARLMHDDPGPAGHPWLISDSRGEAGRTWFRVGAIGARPMEIVADAVALRSVPGSPWTLGEDRGEARRTVEDLVPDTPPKGRRHVTVHLLSATTFGAVDDNYDPFPRASALFGSWRRRWDQYVGQPLPGARPPRPLPSPAATGERYVARAHPGSASEAKSDPLTQWIARRVEVVGGEVSVGRWELRGPGRPRTRAVAAARGRVEIVIACDGTPAAAGALALARFGTFSGSGRHLAFGFGQIFTTEGSGASQGDGLTDLLGLHLPTD